MSSPGPSANRRALFAQMSARSAELTALAIKRLRAEIPAYTQLDPETLAPATRRTIDQLMRVLAEGRELTADELAVFTAHGETRGRQGIPVTEMFRGWRLAVRIAIDQVVTTGRRLGIGDSQLLGLTNELLALTDTAILAVARGHIDADFERTRHDQQRRADLVRGILFGTLSPAEIRVQVERYGLDSDREYRAIRARPLPELPADRVARLLEHTPSGDRPHGLLALVDGDIAGVVDHMPARDIETAVGIGPPARLDRMEPSFRRATRAMATAEAFERTGVYELADLGLLPAVLADTEVGDELVRRYLTPLGRNDSAAALLDTVAHYLGNGMRVDNTAKEMGLHTNTVRYRLRRFQDLTGIDLTDPDRALEAWWALQRRRLSRER
ncbi:PucR family transcriptional regulator [Nocardia suismassiliense]|uniref:PucR family transcriptional regulator n=1 Tax=Nocardia suismassiliense TaxID=2077092 RepID=A0ABW6QXQ1_9NOCA